MPVLTPEELEKKYGVADTARKADYAPFDAKALERKYGLAKTETAPAKEQEDQTDSFIASIIKNSLAETSVGIAARATGAVDYEPKDLGAVGNIASGIGGFVLDPATYVTGGLGSIIGKAAAKKLVAHAVAKKLIPPMVSAGTQLGGLEAVREAAAGEFHPAEIAKATAAGAAFGPAHLAPKGLRTASEVAAMAVPPALLEGRLPTQDDWINAAGTVGGFKVVRAIQGAFAKLKPDAKPEEIKAAVEAEIGPEETAKIEAIAAKPPEPPVVAPVNEKLAALADKPTVSRKEYAEATGTKVGHVPVAEVRKAEAVAAAERLKQEKPNAVDEGQVEVRDPTERAGVDPLRAAEEAGRGDSVQQGGQVEEVKPPAQAVEAQGETVLKQDRRAALVDLPLSSLPPEVAKEIQAEAAMQLESRGGGGLMQPRIKSVKTREALQRIVRDRGEDVGAEVKRQKARLLEYLKGEKDWRTIYEKGIAPETEPSAIIDSYLKGATDEQISRIATELGYGETKAADLPDWVTKRQPGEAARPGLFGQETFDAVTGRQAELPLAPRQETNLADVPGQSTLESPKIAAARAKLDESLEAYRKHTEGKAFSGVEPKSVALLARVFKDELGLGWAKFSDYVASIARKIGAAATRAHAAMIRDTWNEHRKSNPKLDKATDVEPFLKDVPDAPEAIARPDLGVPVQGATAKAGLNVADTVRNIAGEPDPQTFKQWEAEASKMLADRGPQLAESLIDGTWVPMTPADNRAQIQILSGLGKQAAETNDWKDLIRGGLHYREKGADQGRLLASRRAIEDMGMPDQQAFFNQRELAKPPPKVEKQLLAAEAREAREAAEAPAGEPAKPSKRKTAEQIAEEWNAEVKKMQAKLKSLGHDVERALRGELDPIAHREFVRDVNALKATKSDQFYEWWSNSILSGPATQTTNALGNVAHSGWYFTAERITDAFVSSIARSLGFKSDGARFGELKYIYRAFVENWGKSAKNFFETWHSEVPQFYRQHGLEAETAYGYRPGSIPGKVGKAVRTPWRTLAAVDDFVKWQTFEMERASLAYRQAAKEGRKGERLTERMRELLDNSNSEVNQRATDTAIRLAFQEKTKAGDAFTKLRDVVPGGRYVLPFITTPFNILKTGIRKSPFGSLKLASEVLKASKSGDWSHIQPRVAEQVLAWGATLALAYMNDPADPRITGSSGNRPYSVKIGGQWYSYGRIEPFATTLGLLVDGVNKLHQGEGLYESLKAPFDALLERIDNQTFFTGISDLMKAVRYQDSGYALEYAAKFPASWVPNLIRAPVRAAVGEVPQRRVWGKGEERADRMLQRGLQSFEVMPDHPKYDLWGRTTPKDGSPVPHTDWVWRTLSPVGERRYVETIGDRMLTRWNAAHPNDRAEFKPPNPYFTENGEQHYFTDEEYAQYVRESGRLTHQRVIAAQARGALNMNEPTARDIERLSKIIETSRSRIRNALKRARRRAQKEAA